MAEKPDLTDALETLGNTLNWPARAVREAVAVLDAFLDHAEERAEMDFVGEPEIEPPFEVIESVEPEPDPSVPGESPVDVPEGIN